MPRPLTTAVLAAAAIGTPYVATETKVGKTISHSISSLANTVSPPVTQAKLTHEFGNAHHQTESLWKNGLVTENAEQDSIGLNPSQSLGGGPVHDLRDLLRFDISPEWISRHFSRVSTVLSELKLDGLRAPLVTGTRPDDIAGTITYYFDYSGSLQRINLHGFTGDPKRLITTMHQHYHMQRSPSLDAGVSVVRWNGVPTGLLKVTRAPVMYAHATHQKYTIFLELNQPNLQYGLSATAKQIVHSDRNTGRW